MVVTVWSDILSDMLLGRYMVDLCNTDYYIVDSKILKKHRKIFSISSLVKISIT